MSQLFSFEYLCYGSTTIRNIIILSVRGWTSTSVPWFLRSTAELMQHPHPALAPGIDFYVCRRSESAVYRRQDTERITTSTSLRELTQMAHSEWLCRGTGFESRPGRKLVIKLMHIGLQQCFKLYMVNVSTCYKITIKGRAHQCVIKGGGESERGIPVDKLALA